MVEPTSVAAGPLHALARDTLVVRGVDRKTWLDGLLTCAVAGVGGTEAGYGLLLTKQGKIVTDVFLLDDGERLFVGVAAGRGAAVRELLDRNLVMEDAELELPTEALAWRIAASPATGLEPDAVVQGALKLGALEARLFLSARPAEALTDAAQLFAQYGLGTFGVDFDERDNPHEASLDRIAVSWSKGCYLGQEVVCMQDMRGRVKRRLVALDAGAALLGADASRKDVLAADGSVAGQVSSVYPAPGGARVLASISAPALESPGELSVLGERVRVAFGATGNLG
jgi:folate-binding protein YgfZ